VAIASDADVYLSRETGAASPEEGAVGRDFCNGSLVLYGVFIFVQAVPHRDYFLPDPKTGLAMDEEAHAPPPSTAVALSSLAPLLISLVAIVGAPQK
jgi:hypothetical protein